jgi:hypothetical protein
MRYGSLSITQADGSTIEFGIDQVSSTVGRGPANALSIDDASLDQRHARIAIEGGNLLVEDLGSRTGVFVNGMRIPPNTPTVVPDGGTVRFGNVSSVYQPPAGSGANGGQSSSGAERTPPAPVRRGRLELSLVPARVSVEPGSTAYVRAEVQNTGAVVDEVQLEVQGLEAGWLEAPAETIRLLPGERAERTIAITPPRSEEARAGDRPFTVQVASVASADVQASAQGTVEVGAYAEVNFEMTPVRGVGPFSLALSSRANHVIPLSLEARDDEAALIYEFENPFVTLEPGDEATVQLDVSPSKRKLLGQPQAVPFTVTATRTDTPGETAFTAQGQLQVAPPLEKFRRPAMVLVPLLFIGLIAAAAFLMFRGGEALDNGQATPTVLVEDTPTPPLDDAVEAFHLCALEPAERPRLHTGPGLSVFAPNFDGFTQNDPSWADYEYAHAQTAPVQAFWCGDTLAACGCALTSMATVMGMLDLAVLPNNQELSPPVLNDWYREDATLTSAGWVSRGFIYGNVLWTAVNGLSAEMHRMDANMPRLRYSHFGSGTEAEIRADLDRGRPVILEVPGHFVAAIGYTPDGGIRVKDPAYSQRLRLEDYAGLVIKSVHFEPTFNSQAVAVSVPMHLRVRITDDAGNQVGTLDGATPEEVEENFADDIPGASFTIQRAWRDPTCEFSAPEPDQGTIQVMLTGDSNYKVEVSDPEGGELSWAVHIYDAEGNLTLTTGSDSEFEIAKVDDEDGGTPTPPVDTPTPHVDTPTVVPAITDAWLEDAHGNALQDGAMVYPGDQFSVCMTPNQPMDVQIQLIDPGGNTQPGPTLTISGESCPASIHIEDQDQPGTWTLQILRQGQVLASITFVVEPPTQIVRFITGGSCTSNRGINWIIAGDPRASATLVRQRLQQNQWVHDSTLVDSLSPPGTESPGDPGRFHWGVVDQEVFADRDFRYVLTVRSPAGEIVDTAISDVFECFIIIN